MRVERALVGIVVLLGGSLGATAGGCVSNSSPPGATSADGAVIDYDGALPVTAEDGGPPLDDGGPTHSDSPVTTEDAGPGVDATPSPGLVRFAWFVGGVAPPQVGGDVAGPTFDVCIAPHGTGAWMGPLLTQADASTSGLEPFDVTVYFPVVAGQYDARVVQAGSGTCNLPLVDAGPPEDAGPDAAAVDAGPTVPPSDFTSLPAITAGAALTIVLVDPSGLSTSIADVIALHDDTSTAPGQAKVRLANVSGLDTTIALDGGSVPDDGGTMELDGGSLLIGGDFGVAGGIVLSNLFTNVTSAATVAAANSGYVDVAPFTGIDGTLSLQSSVSGAVTTFDSNTLSTSSLDLPAGAILTAFYASEQGNSEQGDIVGRSAPALLLRQGVLVWCYDGQPSASNPLLTKCAFADTQYGDSVVSGVRFGNFVGDVSAGAEDVCLKAHGYGSYVGPLVSMAQTRLNQTVTNLPPDALSAYFNVHGGYAYDARFVAAGATNCATSDGDMTFTAFTGSGGGYTSVLQTGYSTIPADAGTVPPYDAGPPELDDAGPEAGLPPVSAGLTSLAKAIVAIEDVPYNANNTPSIRLVHLDAEHPAPMTLLVSSSEGEVNGGDFVPFVSGWQLDNVPYGGFSTEPQPTDPYGYATMTSGGLTLAIDAVNWPSFNMGSDETSLFAYEASGTIQLLACDDYDEVQYPDSSNALYDTCCVVGSDGCLEGDEGDIALRAKHIAGRRQRR